MATRAQAAQGGARTSLGPVVARRCLCTAYRSHQFYDVEKEEARRHIRVVGTVPNDRQWVPDRVCECLGCGKRFQVEQGEYHHPWWKWTESKAPKTIV
ncbi:hypothetical protein [Lentzea sp. CC55]|uniref:hypothetical protein n=1 Tax=Lentzea sp. CC55 TaxID=2884909 RepID=UPI001F36016C|nr:hypothetical protein [Lentzea sp. CC55]MCG8922625.1 hypothetical protein [Lentzea sp. CC55]